MITILSTLDHIEDSLRAIESEIPKKKFDKIQIEIAKIQSFYESLLMLIPEETNKKPFSDFASHLSYMKHFAEKNDIDWVKSNFDDIRKKDFSAIRLSIYKSLETGKAKPDRKPLSKDVFIVHGKDPEPVRELKTILKDKGFNPIVLYEQASGSRTIVEQLEEYSDVGYAFVILTPDDIGGPVDEIEQALSYQTPFDIAHATKKAVANSFKKRARQNVILEFGYFMGLLSRNRVCCLYKGDVELPSDMHGIVCIRFKKSLAEVKNRILNELKGVNGHSIET